jgi:hypothetical protein
MYEAILNNIEMNFLKVNFDEKRKFVTNENMFCLFETWDVFMLNFTLTLLSIACHSSHKSKPEWKYVQ